MSKYIDADLLRKEVKRLEKSAHKSALGCADSETRKFHEGKDFAYQHVGMLIDSLQQEQQENKPDLVKSLKEYFEKTPKEQLDADWEKLKVWNEIGPDVETYCKTQREQQEVDLDAEIEKELRLHYNDDQDVYWWNYLKNSFRHFYELGKNSK